jgi:hypothetical protein
MFTVALVKIIGVPVALSLLFDVRVTKVLSQ